MFGADNQDANSRNAIAPSQFRVSQTTPRQKKNKRTKSVSLNIYAIYIIVVYLICINALKRWKNKPIAVSKLNRRRKQTKNTLRTRNINRSSTQLLRHWGGGSIWQPGQSIIFLQQITQTGGESERARGRESEGAWARGNGYTVRQRERVSFFLSFVLIFSACNWLFKLLFSRFVLLLFSHCCLLFFA